jgi:hypothetical protein
VRLKPNTVTDTHTTEENMELLPNNTENSISLDNSMLAKFRDKNVPNVERLSDVLGSDALNNLITTAIDIKENTAIVNFSELFTGSKNVIKLTIDNAPVF